MNQTSGSVTATPLSRAVNRAFQIDAVRLRLHISLSQMEALWEECPPELRYLLPHPIFKDDLRTKLDTAHHALDDAMREIDREEKSKP